MANAEVTAATRAGCSRLVLVGAAALLAACGGRPVGAVAHGDGCGPLGCDDAGVPITPPDRGDGATDDEWTVVTSSTSRDLWGVWGSSATDVWTVGDDGTALRWNGAAWRPVETGVTQSLRGVWGSGASDVWIVGHDEAVATGVLLRGDGTTWSTQYSDTFAATVVWGTSPTSVLLAGPQTFLYWDGVTWTLPAAFFSGFTAIWGSDASSVWCVNEVGGYLHLPNTSGGQTGVFGLRGVWGSRPSDPGGVDDVWAVGDDGAITRHGYPDLWTPYPRVTAASLAGVWGSSATDVWAVGRGGTLLHWYGAAWSPTPSGTTRDLHAVWGSGRDDVWVVGAGGTILHRGR